MDNAFDVIVIGTGVMGTTVAFACSSRKRRVAIIDGRPFGGTCALRGCLPKKVLVGAAEIVERVTGMEGKGVHGEIRIDWQKLIEFKKSFTDTFPAELERKLSKAGIESYHGEARFGSEDRIIAADQELRGRHIVIATGARPRSLGIPGEELLTTSEGFLDLERFPERIIFIGGGYISFEFAHIAASAGAHAHIFHRSIRVLGRFEKDIVDMLVKASREKGITIRTNVAVTGVKRKGRHLIVSTENSGEYETDMVMHGAGRVPALENLDLQTAGVRSGPGGIEVNEFLQSVSNPLVYAGGDAAAPGLPLTPVAVNQGEIIATNVLEGNKRSFDASVTPSVIFTNPPLASVGIDEKTAGDRGIDCRVIMEDTSSWYTSRRIGGAHSGFKVLIEKSSDLVVGAHILGAGTEEVINVFALAMRVGMTAAALREMIWSYPTSTSDIRYMLGE
jgi:glutathione reductase (NADPH)